IIISDSVLLTFEKDSAILSKIQSYKGWFFVFASSVLIYFLAKQKLNKLIKLNTKQFENLERIKNIKNKLQLATKSSNIGFWEWNLKNKKVFYSDEWKRQIGYENIEISNSILEWEKRIYPEDSYHIKEKLQEYLKGEITQFEEEFQFKHKNNSFIWVLATALIIKDEFDKPEKVICTHLDITSRKNSELVLKRKQQQLSTLIGNLDGIVYRCKNDENWTMLYLNDGIEVITGYLKEDILQNKTISYAELIVPEDRDYVNEYVQKALNESKKFQIYYRIKAKSGDIKWVFENGIGIYNDNNELIYLEGYIIDITAQKVAEIALKESEKKYRDLVENALIGVYSSHLDGKITYANDALCEMLGYENFNELKSVNIETLYTKKASRKDLIDLLQKHHSVTNVEIELITKQGIKKNIMLSASLMGSEISGMMMDISKLKEYEVELIKAKNEAEKSSKIKDIFIGNVSHEIRTPLNAINGFTNLIKNNLKDTIDSRTGEFFQIIFDASLRLERTLDMMLDFSKLSAGDYDISFHHINLKNVIDKIADEYKYEIVRKDLDLVIEQKTENIEIIGDNQSILNAVTNIINNAIKYTEKGFVKITILSNDESDIILEIQDTGIGISEEYKEKVFQPYSQEEYGYTRQYEGIGLGLSIAKKLLELNGAEISFQSKKGEGSVFTVIFNRKFQDFIEVNPKHKVYIINESKNAENIKRPNILVIEDDIPTKNFLMSLLKNKYNIIKVESIEQVQNELFKNSFDAIVHILYSDKTNEITLQDKLKDDPTNQHIPTIAIVPDISESNQTKVLNLGYNDIIACPLNLEKLYNKISGLIQN
ncbi:PAS domain-containing protein, partial [Bacteroidota bacterium]